MSSAQSPFDLLPPWVPGGPPDEWTLQDVHNHVKTGIKIELTTIPIYLYATWSIKDVGAGKDARSQISALTDVAAVFAQEMLHLALAGNLLSALDGSLDLYDYEIIPRYAHKLLYEEIKVSLDRAYEESIERFKELEAPYHPPSHVLDDTKKYHSIGEFYRALEKALEDLSDSDFQHNQDLQFTKEDFFHFDGELIVIGSRSVAEDRLKLIVQQGEGTGDIHFKTKSHYVIFRDLAEKAPTWEFHNVRTNPKTLEYKGLGNPKDYAYTLSLIFDASYCYLLQNIQRVWQKGGAELHGRLIKNISNLMHRVLAPLADLLIQQKLTGDNDVAAPCFDYYPLNDDGKALPPLEPKALYVEALVLANKALQIAPKDDKLKLEPIVCQIAQSPPE